MDRLQRFLGPAFVGLAATLVIGLLIGCSAGSSTPDAPDTPPSGGPASSPAGDQGSNAITLTVDTRAAGRAVNRQVLGSNMQWVDRGDAMFDDQGQLRPAMLALAQETASTVLRYPGGLQSDTYHWAGGMGPLSARSLNEHANARSAQPTIVGTREFLELCEALGAQPLITVNIATGTAEEAAAWVRQVNITRLTSSRTGRALPKVALWELGNEPYLKAQEQPGTWMSPSTFSSRARQFIAAMRAVDSSIQLILPLTSDRINGFPATPYQGFAREVLRTPMPGLSFVSLHSAYTPLALDHAYTDEQLYWGGMAGSRIIAADLQNMRALLATLMPGHPLPFAMTEYSSLFTLSRAPSDRLPLSPAGALVVADVLRLLASTPDVAMANLWSLSGNDFFGAIHQDGWARPTQQVLKLFGDALWGELIPVQMAAPTVDTQSVGASGAVTGLPLAEAIAVRKGSTLRILVIHKDIHKSATVQLDLGERKAASQHVSVLQSDRLFDRSDRPGVMQRLESEPQPGAALTLPPHSVALITLVFPEAQP
jgi:alpha-N-arabinofuranosidase